MPRQFPGFILSVAILAYAGGAASAIFGIPPAPLIRQSVIEVADFIAHWRNDLGIEPTRLLGRVRPSEIGPAAGRPDRAMPGIRLVSGYFSGRPSNHGALLLDREGRELWFWPISTEAIGVELARHTFLHGVAVLADGSLVVNFDEGHVLARIGACGDVIWARTGEYHHSVDTGADGTFWVSGSPRESQAVSQIDPNTGEALKSVLLDQLAKGIGRGVLTIRRSDAEDQPPVRWMEDRYHLNDVEVLTAEMAPAFPLFDPGDVMISLRSLNLIAVMDSDMRTLKWWQHGPWHRQHDPDFLPNGRISIYDNNMHGGSSRILEIDPATGETRVRFAGTPERPFYSWIRGKHQALPNGNLLITEPQAGRVIEVDPDGEIVWEFQNSFDDARNLLVGDAKWLPQDFFKDGLPDCAG